MAHMGGLDRADQGVKTIHVNLLPSGRTDDDAQHLLRLSRQWTARARRPARAPGFADVDRDAKRVLEFGRDAGPRTSGGIQHAGDLQLVPLPSLLDVRSTPSPSH